MSVLTPFPSTGHKWFHKDDDYDHHVLTQMEAYRTV